MKNQDEKRIIEINGVKLEVDLRTAKMIDQYKIGDNVKLLKKSYNDSYDVYPAVITGFSDFKNLPCIEILYIHNSEVKMEIINDKTKENEIAPLSEEERLFDKEIVAEQLSRSVTKAEEELITIRQKRNTFLKFYGKYFEKKEN